MRRGAARNWAYIYHRAPAGVNSGFRSPLSRELGVSRVGCLVIGVPSGNGPKSSRIDDLPLIRGAIASRGVSVSNGLLGALAGPSLSRHCLVHRQRIPPSYARIVPAKIGGRRVIKQIVTILVQKHFITNTYGRWCVFVIKPAAEVDRQKLPIVTIL